jgi:hypothetical protein
MLTTTKATGSECRKWAGHDSGGGDYVRGVAYTGTMDQSEDVWPWWILLVQQLRGGA